MPCRAEIGPDRVGENLPEDTAQEFGRRDRVFQVVVLPERTGPVKQCICFMCRLTFQCAEDLRSGRLFSVEPARIDNAMEMVGHNAIKEEIVFHAVFEPQRFCGHHGNRRFTQPERTGAMPCEIPVKLLEAGQLLFRECSILHGRFHESGENLSAGHSLFGELAQNMRWQGSRETQGSKARRRSGMVERDLNALCTVVR